MTFEIPNHIHTRVPQGNEVHQASILSDSLCETEMAIYTYSVGAYHYVNTLALLQQLPLPPSPLPLTPPPLPLVLPVTQPTVSLCCDEHQQKVYLVYLVGLYHRVVALAVTAGPATCQDHDAAPLAWQPSRSLSDQCSS